MKKYIIVAFLLFVIKANAQTFKVGQQFDGVILNDIKGNKYDLTKPDGKIYVINFWFINCPPCRQEIPELNQIVESNKGKDVVFIAIAMDNKERLIDFLKSTVFRYNIVSNGNYLADRYGIEGFPTHVIVGKNGKIKYTTLGLGRNTISDLNKSIAKELKQKV